MDSAHARVIERLPPDLAALLALGLVAAVLLAPGLWLSFGREVQGISGDWISNFEHTVSLLLAGILTSTKRPGWRVLGILTGASFLYLGAAALAVPDTPGSWGLTGGIPALLGGAGYIALTLYEARRTAHAPAVSRQLQ